MRNELDIPADNHRKDTSATRLNALRHGILSSEALLSATDSREDRDLFDQLSDALRTQLAPDGALEHLLVDKLVMLLWRWRRVVRYETHTIPAATPGPPPELPGRYRHIPLSELEDSLAQAQRDLEALALPPLRRGHALFLRVFEVAKLLFDVDPDDVLGKEPDWQRHFHLRPRDVRRVVRLACKNANVREVVFWNFVDTHIRREIERLQREIQGEKADLASVRLAAPDYHNIDKLRRYEAHLSRQFYRALHELQRLQAARQGHPQLPPVAVDLLVDGPSPAYDPDDT